jgi:hypothetical protein
MKSEWLVIATGAVLTGIIGAVFSLGAWLLNRMVAGFDDKIREVHDKLVLHSKDHYEKEEDLNVRVSVLEERTKKL